MLKSSLRPKWTSLNNGQVTWGPPPPCERTDWLTHMTESITFPQLHWPTVVITDPKGKVMFSQVSVCPQSASWLIVHCSALLRRGRYASYWNAFLYYFVCTQYFVFNFERINFSCQMHRFPGKAITYRKWEQFYAVQLYSTPTDYVNFKDSDHELFCIF